jgi:hypothetical protein
MVTTMHPDLQTFTHNLFISQDPSLQGHLLPPHLRNRLVLGPLRIFHPAHILARLQERLQLVDVDPAEQPMLYLIYHLVLVPRHDKRQLVVSTENRTCIIRNAVSASCRYTQARRRRSPQRAGIYMGPFRGAGIGCAL